MDENSRTPEHVVALERDALEWLRTLSLVLNQPQGEHARTLLDLVDRRTSDVYKNEGKPGFRLEARLQEAAEFCLDRQSKLEYMTSCSVESDDSEGDRIATGLLALADSITQGVVILSAAIAGKKTD